MYSEVAGTLIEANQKKKKKFFHLPSTYKVALLCSTIATGEFTLIFRSKNL